MDEGPDQGAGRNTASEALAPQARVDSFIEAHRQRLSQGSHLRPQPYTSRPPPATDRSAVVLERRHPGGLRARQHDRRGRLPMRLKHLYQNGGAAHYLRGRSPSSSACDIQIQDNLLTPRISARLRLEAA